MKHHTKRLLPSYPQHGSSLFFASYRPHMSDKTILRFSYRVTELKRLYGACGVSCCQPRRSLSTCQHFPVFISVFFNIGAFKKKRYKRRRFPVNTVFSPTFRTFAFSVRVRFLNVRLLNILLNKYPPFEMFSSLYAHSFLLLLFLLLPLPIQLKQNHFPHCHNHGQ